MVFSLRYYEYILLRLKLGLFALFALVAKLNAEPNEVHSRPTMKEWVNRTEALPICVWALAELNPRAYALLSEKHNKEIREVTSLLNLKPHSPKFYEAAETLFAARSRIDWKWQLEEQEVEKLLLAVRDAISLSHDSAKIELLKAAGWPELKARELVQELGLPLRSQRADVLKYRLNTTTPLLSQGGGGRAFGFGSHFFQRYEFKRHIPYTPDSSLDVIGSAPTIEAAKRHWAEAQKANPAFVDPFQKLLNDAANHAEATAEVDQTGWVRYKSRYIQGEQLVPSDSIPSLLLIDEIHRQIEINYLADSELRSSALEALGIARSLIDDLRTDPRSIAVWAAGNFIKYSQPSPTVDRSSVLRAWNEIRIAEQSLARMSNFSNFEFVMSREWPLHRDEILSKSLDFTIVNSFGGHATVLSRIELKALDAKKSGLSSVASIKSARAKLTQPTRIELGNGREIIMPLIEADGSAELDLHLNLSENSLSNEEVRRLIIAISAKLLGQPELLAFEEIRLHSSEGHLLASISPMVEANSHGYSLIVYSERIHQHFAFIGKRVSPELAQSMLHGAFENLDRGRMYEINNKLNVDVWTLERLGKDRAQK